MRTVAIAEIAGSVGRAHELADDFRPRHGARRRADDDRLERIRSRMERDRGLPPVELYKLGDVYYVLDGHHRVAAARLNGQLDVDAHVVEYVVHPAACMSRRKCAA
jgi:ParB-like chromosome segregation protein Spo0J